MRTTWRVLVALVMVVCAGPSPPYVNDFIQVIPYGAVCIAWVTRVYPGDSLLPMRVSSAPQLSHHTHPYVTTIDTVSRVIRMGVDKGRVPR